VGARSFDGEPRGHDQRTAGQRDLTAREIAKLNLVVARQGVGLLDGVAQTARSGIEAVVDEERRRHEPIFKTFESKRSTFSSAAKHGRSPLRPRNDGSTSLELYRRQPT